MVERPVVPVDQGKVLKFDLTFRQRGSPTDPLPGQRRLIRFVQQNALRAERENVALTVVAIGGWGSGKTEGAVVAFLAVAMMGQPGAKYLLIAQTDGDAETVILEKVLSYFPAAYPDQPNLDKIEEGQLSPMIDYVSKKKKFFRLKVWRGVDGTKVGGQVFHWGSASSVKAMAGQSATGLLADEFYMWRLAEARAKLSRVRDGKGPMIIAIASLPPIVGTGAHTLVTEWERNPRNAIVVRMRSDDNVYAGADYAERLSLGMTEQEARRYRDGESVSTAGNVLYNYRPELVRDGGNILPYKFDPERCVRAGLDFGVKRPAVVFFQLRRGKGERDEEWRDGEWVIFDELVASNLNTESLARLIRARAIEQGYRLTHIACDPAGSHQTSNQDMGKTDVSALATVLRDLGTQVVYQKLHQPKYRPVAVGISAMNFMFKGADGRTRLWVSEDMTRRRYDGRLGFHDSAMMYTYVDPETHQATPDKIVKDGLSDHFCDAARYACIYWGPKVFATSMAERRPVAPKEDRVQDNGVLAELQRRIGRAKTLFGESIPTRFSH